MGLLRNHVYTSILRSYSLVMKLATLVHEMYATMKRSTISTPHAYYRFSTLFYMFGGRYSHLMSLYINGPSGGICKASRYYFRTIQVSSLICSDPWCVFPWTWFCLQRRTFTVSIISGDFFTSCSALFTTTMRVPTIFGHGRGCTVSWHWTPESLTFSFFAICIWSTIQSSHGHAIRSHPRPSSEDQKSIR